MLIFIVSLQEKDSLQLDSNTWYIPIRKLLLRSVGKIRSTDLVVILLVFTRPFYIPLHLSPIASEGAWLIATILILSPLALAWPAAGYNGAVIA